MNFLLGMKNLLKEVIPVPIVMINKMPQDQFQFQCNFWNSAFFNLLYPDQSPDIIEHVYSKDGNIQIKTNENDKNFNDEILEKLKQINVTEEKEINESSQISSTLNVSDDILEKFKNLLQNQNQSKTIFNYLSQYENEEFLNKKHTISLIGIIKRNMEEEYDAKYLEIKIVNIIWEGKKSYAICLNDIGEYVKLNEYKNNLLASVSHKLRTPLSNIEGNIDLAISECKEKETKLKLKNVKMATALLLSTINDVLDFSLYSQNKLKLNIEEIVLYDFLLAITKIIKRLAKIKNLTLKFE